MAGARDRLVGSGHPRQTFVGDIANASAKMRNARRDAWQE